MLLQDMPRTPRNAQRHAVTRFTVCRVGKNRVTRVAVDSIYAIRSRLGREVSELHRIAAKSQRASRVAVSFSREKRMLSAVTLPLQRRYGV